MKRSHGLLLVAGLLLLAGWRVHPWLAVNAPTDARVLAVEGWLPTDRMPEVVTLARERGAERIYVTGTERVFAYYIWPGERLEMDLGQPFTGTLSLDASGVGGGFRLLGDGRTLLEHTVTGPPQVFTTTVEDPVRDLELQTLPNGASPDAPQLFIKDLHVNGTDVHRRMRSLRRIRANGDTLTGTPTHAEAAAEALIAAGWPADLLVVRPVTDAEGGRSAANAQALAQAFRRDGIHAVDLVTLGVHARRSGRLLQRASGEEVQVGVISLADPECPASTWWLQGSGWAKVAKELVALCRD